MALVALIGASEQARKGFAELHVRRRDVTGLEVRVMRAFEVRGFVEREEPRDKDGNRKVSGVYLLPEAMGPDFHDKTFHEQDGSFVLKKVYPGRYRVLPVGYAPGFYVASVWYGDQEVTTRSVEIVNPPQQIRIVYRNGAASVTGTVEKGEGAWVVLTPQDEALRDSYQHIRSAKCGEGGRFSIDSLRPGSYYAFAFDRLEQELLEEPEFVRKIAARATPVEVRHGETVNLELRPQAWPDY